jgi:hypothetical protein
MTQYRAYAAITGLAILGFLSLISSGPTYAGQSTPATADAAFERYWDADSPEQAVDRVDAILKSGITFEDAYDRLAAGRTYEATDPGVVMRANRMDRVDHYYAVTVPPSYDPEKRYPVRFQLHGGVGGRTTNQPRGNGAMRSLVGAEQFYVIPYAWIDSPWWSDDQVRNLSAIVDSLKRTYNIDENGVVVSGASDGGTGAYYIAMRDTTPYASFLPLNGFLMVLGNDRIDNGTLHPHNLSNKPWFVVNGGQDRLYPTVIIDPLVDHLKTGGVSVDYYPQPEAGHNTRWWPEMKDPFEAFVADHPRDPHPPELTWEASYELEQDRAHWLVIDRLGVQANDSSEMPSLNDAGDVPLMKRYADSDGRLFSKRFASGRVDVIRSGNTFRATTRGVVRFTLLLSPDVVDFDEIVTVIVNGQTAFRGKVNPDLATLLKWAAWDNDRTMLYGAEVQIRLDD